MSTPESSPLPRSRRRANKIHAAGRRERVPWRTRARLAARMSVPGPNLGNMANSQGPGPGTQLIAHAIVGWACTAAIARMAGKPLTAAAKLLAFLAGVVVHHLADAPVANMLAGLGFAF
jgi:hypothetical protein